MGIFGKMIDYINEYFSKGEFCILAITLPEISSEKEKSMSE